MQHGTSNQMKPWCIFNVICILTIWVSEKRLFHRPLDSTKPIIQCYKSIGPVPKHGKNAMVAPLSPSKYTPNLVSFQ